MLDALATLRPSTTSDLAGPALCESGGLLAVLGAVGPADVDALVAVDPAWGSPCCSTPRRGAPPRRAAPGVVAAAAAALRRVGWLAVVATAASRPEQVWDELTATAVVR